MKFTIAALVVAGLVAAWRHVRSPETSAAQAASAQPAAARRPKLATCLWFDGQAEEAVRFYTALFADSKVLGETRWGEGGFAPAGSILEITFQLDGREFMALNGGPMFHFNEAVSMVVRCDSQAEIDRYWEKLGAGGTPSRCGWLKDKYGLSWQIVPTALETLMRDPDAAKSKRVVDALQQMDKIDLARLERAHAGR